MNPPTLVDRLSRASNRVLVLALVAVGLTTAALLYLEAFQSTDRALLAAANAYGTHAWEPEYGHSPVQVRVATHGDPLLPMGVDPGQEGDEHPLIRTVADLRVLVLTVENAERHTRILATAPVPTLVGAVGDFTIAYALVSLLVAMASFVLQRRQLAQAVAPLHAARDDVKRAMAGGQGQRVTPQGPDEVRTLLAAVDDLLVQRDAAFATQARFTAEAAHELRTPLTSMRGGIDVALRRPRSADELAGTLREAREDVARLSDLVDGLLLLARVDSGQAAQARETVQASEIAGDAARREAGAIRTAGGTLALHIGADATLQIHRALLTAAVGNLLRNAAVHAPGTPVSLRVQRDGARLVFVVEDGGGGVAPSEREAMFDRLARSGSARPARDGLGLGLPLAREIARRHGGDCKFADGAASRVELWVPIVT